MQVAGVTKPAGTPVQRFTKANAKDIQSFAGSPMADFQKTFSAIGKMKLPAGSSPATSTPPPRQQRGTKRKATAAPSSASPSNTKRTPSSSSSSSFAPASSPASGVDYEDRTDAGTTVLELTPTCKIASDAPRDFSAIDGSGSVEVKLVGEGESKESHSKRGRKEGYKFMLTLLEQRAEALVDRVLAMEALCAKRKMVLTAVGVPSEKDVTVCGRICSAKAGAPQDGAGREEDCRLNVDDGLMLEGSNGVRVKLLVRKLRSFNFVPGQVVVVKGKCSSVHSGGKLTTFLHAAQLLEGISAYKAAPPASPDTKSLRVWAASGPFCLHKDLKYRPLRELFAEAADAPTPPDVIVLTGPFVDVKHPTIGSGRIELPKKSRSGKRMMVGVTFADLFAQRVASTISTYLATEALQGCHVVLLPSLNDAHTVPAFPQVALPPLEIKSSAVRARVHSMDNPSTFSVNGVTFGAVAVDYIAAGFKCGITHPPVKMDARCAKVAEGMVAQRSYYPMFPSTKDVPLELTQSHRLTMPVTPDILLTPSALPCFAKQIKNQQTLVVNPRQLCRGNSAGSYSKLTVYPAPPTAAGKKPVPVAQRTHVQVVRI